MSKYDSLDAKSELEQTITADLKKALEKRGLEVRHNGSSVSHAPANKPDIEAFSSNIHVNIEVTKRTKSNAEGEFLSIKDHLEKVKNENSTKKCYLLYVSPETNYRMINAIRDFNALNQKKEDMKIMPICFKTFEIFINKLIETHKDEYPINKIMSLFDEAINFIDDERILKIFFTKLFYNDLNLGKEVELVEEQKHQERVEHIIKELLHLEDCLREELGVTHIDAVRNIIFLVFIKLYEEKREFEGKKNRFKQATFKEFQQDVGQEMEKKAIETLFGQIKQDPELKNAKAFTEKDVLADKLNDDFIIKFFIEPFEKYYFYTTKIDGIGAVYEVLGMRAGKDVKAGQFFTPENVVRFMVKLAELDPDDVILDPACGTGRFLIYAMEDMISKAQTRKNPKEKIKEIQKTQLLGTDYDANVAKLAKMNMYIHKDGKTNIKDMDGLLLFNLDQRIDIILTNPPLGDQSYNKTGYDDDFKLIRMEVIPKKLIKKPVNDIKYEVTGNSMKGGALFINASWHYLKPVRDINALPEWRGGKLLIVLDEGILNTENYKDIRDFIKRNFYIKAIISLTRDTFVPVSSTTTKTSILYAIKKDDPDAIQQEPIFFAHAEKVGINTRKKVCPNHLFNDGNDIISRYMEFKEIVLASYDGVHFNKMRFTSGGFSKGEIDD